MSTDKTGYDALEIFEQMDELYRLITISKGYDWDKLSEDSQELLRDKYTNEMTAYFDTYLSGLAEFQPDLKKDILFFIATGMQDKVLLQRPEIIRQFALGMQAYLDHVVEESEALLENLNSKE